MQGSFLSLFMFLHRELAAGVTAACGGLWKLILSNLASLDYALFTPLFSASNQLTHLVLDGVELPGNA